MNSRYKNFNKTLEDVMLQYHSKSMLDNVDKMIEFDTKLEWMIKHLEDMKNGAALQFAYKHKKQI